jgi:hypothetical protein
LDTERLKADVERHFDDEVRQAVVTVPAMTDFVVPDRLRREPPPSTRYRSVRGAPGAGYGNGLYALMRGWRGRIDATLDTRPLTKAA